MLALIVNIITLIAILYLVYGWIFDTCNCCCCCDDGERKCGCKKKEEEVTDSEIL